VAATKDPEEDKKEQEGKDKARNDEDDDKSSSSIKIADEMKEAYAKHPWFLRLVQLDFLIDALQPIRSVVAIARTQKQQQQQGEEVEGKKNYYQRYYYSSEHENSQHFLLHHHHHHQRREEVHVATNFAQELANEWKKKTGQEFYDFRCYYYS